jgi:hypothetical protein
MANRSNPINVSAAAEVSSIQITINLGRSTAEPAQTTSDAPQGTFFRQVFLEPGDPQVKKILTSFVPDDLAEGATTQLADPDPGELSKWKQLLGDELSEEQIDAGKIAMRITEEGGTITWLPDDRTLPPFFHQLKQRTEEEPGGASIGDFIVCWREGGATAAAGVNCWSQL